MTSSRMRVLFAAAVLCMASVGVSAGATWDVYPGGSIQDAIDGAGEGDTIYVHVGTYIENVDVDKRITLIGDGAGMAATNVYLILGTDINCAFLYRWHQTNIAYKRGPKPYHATVLKV